MLFLFLYNWDTGIAVLHDAEYYRPDILKERNYGLYFEKIP